MALIRTMVRPSRFSSDPILAARSASDGSHPSSRRSSSRAASSSRRWRRTPRGQASLRSASIIAPRMRRSANVSNLMPARLVEAVRRIDEADDAVLNQVADVDRVGHGGRHAAGKLLDEGKAGNDAGFCLPVAGASVVTSGASSNATDSTKQRSSLGRFPPARPVCVS